MTWFAIHLRNGKNILVEGEAARDRAMAKKSPVAVSWAVPTIHRCCVCRTSGPWDSQPWNSKSKREEGWCWIGVTKNADAGRKVEKFCSRTCRLTRYPAHPESERDLPWNERLTLGSFEPLPYSKRWNEWTNRREREQAFKAHRKFELPAHQNNGNGWCRWCGGEIIDREGKNKGKRSVRRTWHRWSYGDPSDCYQEYLLHTDRDEQWWFIAQRDGIGCADCGRGDGKWIGHVIWHNEAQGTGFCRAVWSVKLEVDHETPLWRIPELPPDKPEWRRALFGPANLRLRCIPCHQKKSAAEAAQRAAMREKPEL